MQLGKALAQGVAADDAAPVEATKPTDAAVPAAASVEDQVPATLG